jgi:ligand-binding sensor domain-containing protein
LPEDPLDTKSYAQINDIAAAGGNLYACSFTAGVCISQNGGSSWTPINSGLTKTDVYSLAVNGSDIFAGTGSGGGVFVSSDKGATWAAINNGLVYMPGMVYSVHRLTASNGRLFAGTISGGVYRTENNGEIWIGANSGLFADNVLSLHAHSGNLFAGTGSGGVFQSPDNGASWTAISEGLPGSDAVLCLCSTNDGLFAGLYGSGVWRLPLLATSVALERSPKNNVFGISGNSMVLRYSLPVASHVSIKYHDLAGRLLASFVDRDQEAGTYSMALPSLPNGFYVRDFRAGSFTQKDKIRMLR